MDQKLITAEAHAFHPIVDYLEGLPPWDGVERAETLLIKYLGAEDSIYTREATKKLLTAAVKRIYEPGCKFDNMLVLSGGQGIGKSTILSKLGGKWFSDNLTFEDMKDKTAAEKIQSAWIIELPEMKGLRNMDVESVKSAISRQVDIYRPAYGRNVVERKRQCVFVGTVNDLSGYLKDVTGNRRFWPIEVSGDSEAKVWEMTDEERDQVWAEIMFCYRELGEDDLLLSDAAIELAAIKQTAAIESDEREGLVEEYLRKLLPDDWKTRNAEDRISYFEDYDIQHGSNERTEVTVMEIWCECFRNQKSKLTMRDSRDIIKMLKRLGWSHKNRRMRVVDYGLQRLYERD